jgi:trehalose 6-phosphate phosphatase
VAFHYRAAADPVAARAAILEALDRAEGEIPDRRFERFDGRRVVELRPEGAGAKGAALAALIARQRPGAVIVLGDDVSDAEAFRVVRDARADGAIAGLALGVHGGRETPPEISAAADVVLPTPRDAGRLLGALASALEREAAASPQAVAGGAP